MGRSHESFGKKDVRTKKEKRRKEKEQKRLQRKENKTSGGIDDMLAYVDEFGNITSTPPDISQRTTVDAENIVISVPKAAEPDPADLIRQGIVSFFDEGKGFGFIKDLGENQDIFVHVSGLQEPIKEGNKVTYEVEKGQKGLIAVNVKVDRSKTNISENSAGLPG